MTLSRLPLGYCTNVHPGRTVAEVNAGLDRYTVPVMRKASRPIAAGLWLARPVIDELLVTPDCVARFAAGLADRSLSCHTLNAFPYGDFHAARVKENVYLPDWTSPDRLTYTAACAVILAALLAEDEEGSISTLPLGFKGFDHTEDFLDTAARQLVDCATMLSRIARDTGRTIRLAIEPEPFCLVETTDEAIAFFQRLWHVAGSAEATVRRHIGLCYDVCHQAVEFEDVAESVRELARAGVRINKVQISCAIQLDQPRDNPDGLAALRRYVEPRYLHQTFARMVTGQVIGLSDLTEEGLTHPLPEFREAEAWRIHFHVPVDTERLGPLSTTRPTIAEVLAAVAALDYAPHLEVETYTWEVLPGSDSPDLVTGLTRELLATQTLIDAAH